MTIKDVRNDSNILTKIESLSGAFLDEVLGAANLIDGRVYQRVFKFWSEGEL